VARRPAPVNLLECSAVYTSNGHIAIRLPMAYPELQTDRLILVPLKLEDAEQTQRLFPEWEIVRYLTARVPWPYPAGTALESYRDSILPAIERGDEWHWTLRLKAAPEQHIGVVSLYRDEWDSRGYWLGLPWQGQGYMTEAVLAATDYWFHVEANTY